MSSLVVLILFILVVVAGFLWGRNTIKRDTERTEKDDEQLDKLHKLRG
jgi:hypothetical protein